jgi:hypothetical protein
LRKLSSSRRSSIFFMSAVASFSFGQSMPSPGSRSKMRRSGLSAVARAPRPIVTFEVWNSTTFIWAAATSASREAISIIGSWPGQIEPGNSRTPVICRVSACFWKNCWPSIPAGARTSVAGRPARCGRMYSAIES